MTRRRLLIVAALATLLVCGSIAVINTRAFQVHYHGWQMQRASAQRFSKERRSIIDGVVVYSLDDALARSDANKRYEYHRQRLVELGRVAERQYTFKHVQTPTPESSHFTHLLSSGPCPNSIDFESPYPDKPEPMQLTVWCHPADAKAWDDFVAEHDVSDYRDRFMPTEKGTLAIQPPAGWNLEHRTAGGLVDFYALKTGSGEVEGLLMFSKWPPPNRTEEIPGIVRKLADGFLEEAKKSAEFTLSSEKYEIEQFAGDHCQGSYVTFQTASGGTDALQAMFMMSVDGEMWSGQFTGKPDHWTVALGLLKALKKKA